MSKLARIRAQSRWPDILEGQGQHLILTVLLVAGAFSLLRPEVHPVPRLGLTATGWAHLSIWLAVAHQVIVALVFRLQLHRALMTRLFKDHAMQVWAVIFMPLLLARPVTVIMTGWADATPITSWRGVEVVLGLILVALAAWVMHSVIRHFTMVRALGGDHFEDRFARMPMVREGAFRYTDNAMYGVAFLGLWGIALLFGSWNALVVALFQHAYIWVHMYGTENPDLAWIHGSR